MLKKMNIVKLLLFCLAITLIFTAAQSVFAAAPIVKTVPWVATNPLIPHDTWSGKSIRLKGTSSAQGANYTYTWDFGDGSPVASGTVSNMWAIEASHVYTGIAGTVYTATLTVQDTSIPAPNTGIAQYYVAIRDKNLNVEVNVAIDEGLWYLHKGMTRYAESGMDMGRWQNSYSTETPANLNAFFVNGHLETGAASNPYTDTVKRGMRRLFQLLTVVGGIPQTKSYGAPLNITVNPDSNVNGIAIRGADSYTYSSGIFMDAIVASGTPETVTTTGNANVINRKYKDIIQDMVDGYAYGQTNNGSWMGGWGYDWMNGSSDNSVNQWATIGLMAAKEWSADGVIVPDFIAAANQTSLANTHGDTSGGTETYFRYTNNGDAGWGWMGTTPAGMVQMINDGIIRGQGLWDRTENYIRNRFCSTGWTGSPRDYYYGLFSFTKSMLLYPGGSSHYLYNQPGNANPLDWYAAEASAGAQCDGVARTLVTDQAATGRWSAQGGNGYHEQFATAWAIIMLNRTVFASGVPVAVVQAIPNPAVAGQIVQLSGSPSFHQDPAKSIVAWAWDLNNDDVYETVGLTTATSFGAVGNYAVKLRVTDNVGATASTTITLVVNTPPVAPTASAGGPYNFCPGKNWFLDGSKSQNPDDGNSEPGYPGDFIQEYAWDLDGDNLFDDAFGIMPNVTDSWAPGTSLNISLRVTDNTLGSFPSSGQQDLTGFNTTQVLVREADDPACNCVTNLAGTAKSGIANLLWTWRAGAHHYNVYRSTINGGPYVKVGSVSSPVLIGGVSKGIFAQTGLISNVMYYYVVREAAINDTDLCQSNQISVRSAAKPAGR